MNTGRGRAVFASIAPHQGKRQRTTIRRGAHRCWGSKLRDTRQPEQITWKLNECSLFHRTYRAPYITGIKTFQKKNSRMRPQINFQTRGTNHPFMSYL